MKISNLNDPQIFKSSPYKDDRGYFFPLDLDPMWVQSNIIISNMWAFRGLHYQKGEFSQSKLLTVIRGEIIDFIVDLRPESFGMVHRYEMQSGDALFIPRGFAHGFLSLKDKTICQYLVDNRYSPENEISIFWKSIPDVKKYIESRVFSEYLIISSKDLVGDFSNDHIDYNTDTIKEIRS